MADVDRLKRLINEWHAVYAHRVQTADDVNRIVEQINLLVTNAEANRSLAARMRVEKELKKKVREIEKARDKRDQVEQEMGRKDREIAEVVAALWAAATKLTNARTVPAADLAAVNGRLDRIDGDMERLAAVLGTLREAVDRQADSAQSPFTAPAAAQAGNGGEGIIQVGPSPGDHTAPALTDQELAELPENVTVLLFASEPRDWPRPDLDKEIREISAKIDEAEFGHRVKLRAWTATQPFDLLPNLNRHKPHMVQFSGHGREDGVLLMGPRDDSAPIDADRLVQMLKWTNENLRIVFFNICDSEVHARLTAKEVDAVIGLRGELRDTPAREFAAQLYSALAFGAPVHKAFHQACAAIADWPESGAPQLFFRAGSDPRKVVLVRP
jgi:hypothetical protein